MKRFIELRHSACRRVIEILDTDAEGNISLGETRAALTNALTMIADLQQQVRAANKLILEMQNDNS